MQSLREGVRVSVLPWTLPNPGAPLTLTLGYRVQIWVPSLTAAVICVFLLCRSIGG